MAYQFPLITGPNNETIYQDWCGYNDCMSVKALEEFEAKKTGNQDSILLVEQKKKNLNQQKNKNQQICLMLI